MGRDWLNYLQYAIEPKTKGKLIHSINNICQEKQNHRKSGQGKIKIPRNVRKTGPNKASQNPFQTARRRKSKAAKRTHPTARFCKIRNKQTTQRRSHSESWRKKEDALLQPTVITVKKDRSVKIALDAREQKCLKGQKPDAQS